MIKPYIRTPYRDCPVADGHRCSPLRIQASAVPSIGLTASPASTRPRRRAPACGPESAPITMLSGVQREEGPADSRSEEEIASSRVLHWGATLPEGHVKAKKTLDINFSSLVYHLFPLSNVCKEIHVIQVTKSSMDHFTQWLENGDRATDWSYAAKRACHLEGNKQDWKEKEIQTKKAIKRVYEWYDYETSDIDPSVPKVDCVTAMWLLNVISQSKEEYQRNLKKFTSLLKPGGHLVLFSVVNMSSYKVGDQRICILPMEETDIQESVIKTGFIIEKSWKWAAVEPTDIVDYSHMCFILARKEK